MIFCMTIRWFVWVSFLQRNFSSDFAVALIQCESHFNFAWMAYEIGSFDDIGNDYGLYPFFG